MVNKRHGVLCLFLQALVGSFIIFIISCSNSEIVSSNNNEDVAYYSSSTKSAFNTDGLQEVSSSEVIDYLPIDDSEYPYAGIPRIVIETEDHRAIRDRETEIPAKLQIWGENTPKSEIMALTIRGRGNSSWVEMPKKSYKIEFMQKQTLLDMPTNKDWILLANYADKTLLKNYTIFQLARLLNSSYPPRGIFIELYLNREYLGVYLLTESIKKGRHRVNISDQNLSYIVEFDSKKKPSDIGTYSNLGKFLNIHYPKNPTDSVLSILENRINEIEQTLWRYAFNDSILSTFFDIDAYLSHYWIQEFSKNPDAFFGSSVYFSWEVGQPIKMGPVWDFDIAFGVHFNEEKRIPSGWFIRQHYWNRYLFNDSTFKQHATDYWINNHRVFYNILDSLESYKKSLQFAAQNNFKKWNILKDTQLTYHRKSFSTYDETIDDLKNWISQRYNWINDNIGINKK